MSCDIDQPDVSVAIDRDAVSADVVRLLERLNETSALVEFDYRMLTAVVDPHVIIGVDCDTGGLAEVPTVGELRPIDDDDSL